MKRDFAFPGTRPQFAPDRQFDIQHYRIAVDLDLERKAIRGTCAITVAAIGTARQWLELDAVEMDIEAVRIDNRALTFHYDERRLRIDLGEPLAAGEAATIEVVYATVPRRGLYFIAPSDAYPTKARQVWSQGQDRDSRYWFPCFDAPHQKSTTEVIATVPATFYALSNGGLVNDHTEGDRRTMHWRFDTPHSCYLVTLVAAEFSRLVERAGDIDISYYVQPGREDDALRCLGRTPKMIALFSDLFGVPYPYEKYAQVFVADFIFGGMENTTATTLTDSVLYDERASLDWDADDLVAHELAHQWFGDLLTCRDWGEGWLNEGFATYSEYLWNEHQHNRDEAWMVLDDFAQNYFGEDSDRYRRRVATKHYENPIDVFDHHLYEKGGRILHMLRHVLGDDAFWHAIRHYLTKHRHGAVETRDLARAIEDATGRVLDWFFSQWVLDGAGHPELSVTLGWDPDQHMARIAVEQTHDVGADTPLFRLPTSVRFRVDGQDHDHAIEISEKNHVFFVTLAGEPTQMIFDPGKVLLAKVKTDKAAPLWRDELAGAAEAADRIHAAAELATRGGRLAEQALGAALESDPFWGVAARAAKSLGELRTEGARQRLLSATTNSHPKTRRAVVAALGGFRHDLRAADAVAGIVEAGDASYFVEAEACLSLGKLRDHRASALLRGAATRPAFLDVVRCHAFRGLAELRDADAIPFLLAETEVGKSSYGRRAAMAAAATICRGQRDRQAQRVREVLEDRLDDFDFRVQSAALEALHTLGLADAIAAIQRTVDQDLDGRLRRRGREIIRELAGADGENTELHALRDELTSLRDTVAKLGEQLDRESAAASRDGSANHKAQHKAGKKADKKAAKKHGKSEDKTAGKKSGDKKRDK